MKSNTKIALSVIAICLYYAWLVRPTVERIYVYPVTYKSIVIQEADKNNIDPTLIAAVILAESKYNELAVSDPGAKGLMQIMPETANWIQEQRNLPKLSKPELHMPEKNIALGSWYLSKLLKDFNGNEILALASYNAGIGRVNSWMKKYGWKKDFNNPSEIPYSETRAYVKKVLAYRKKYKELYGYN